ncbi:hypothetical protein MNBD_PLANCTO02-22 [hydrothermal vent metagenome]|uniref:Uncharacterized protein n=1 Tax=hydrothermal vent metagenome TaxID=652676 RepID=A0A3B1DJW5_9ZZZZ
MLFHSVTVFHVNVLGALISFANFEHGMFWEQLRWENISNRYDFAPLSREGRVSDFTRQATEGEFLYLMSSWSVSGAATE